MSNRDRALFLAGLGIPVVPEHTPDPSTTTGCDCHHADCIKPGKHPRTKNGSLDATTIADQITSWWGTIWPHANIGTDAGKANLVVIAPDCPERDAEFQALGLEGAVVVQSGGGDGHRQYWFKRSADFPQTRVCKPDDYDIMSNGNVIMPGSRHASGRLYSFVGEPVAIDQLPEQPAWVWNWVKKARANGATAGGEDDPPVRLHLRGLKRWDGELVQKKKSGDTDRSDSLYYLALDLAECNASRSAIVAALAERDIALGWCKYSDRNDADDRYGEVADKAIAYEDERRTAQPTDLQPPTPAVGNDGAHGCAHCGPTFAQNADLLAANADLRASFTALANVLKIPNEALPAARKIVAIGATFELLSKESRAKVPGVPHRLYGKTVAEKAGVALSTARDTLEMLSGEVGIFERHEAWEKMSTTTGEVFDIPRRVLEYRPCYPSAPATFGALVEAFEPKTCARHPEAGPVIRCDECREAERAERAAAKAAKGTPKLCKDHPEAGTVVRCAVCFASLPGGTPANPKRKRPSSLEDYMGEQAGLPHCDVNPSGDLDQMADEPPSPGPERLVELGAALGWPALIVNRRVTIPEGQDAWQGFAAVANGTLAMAIAAAAAYEPSALADQMAGFTGPPPVGTPEAAPDRIDDLQRRHGVPPSLDDEFEQIVRSAGVAS